MKCPIDNTILIISDRQGIEIDYCPDCRGIWLDRGELDRIVERLEDVQPTKQDERYDNSTKGKPKRRESWLSELFD